MRAFIEQSLAEYGCDGVRCVMVGIYEPERSEVAARLLAMVKGAQRA